MKPLADAEEKPEETCSTTPGSVLRSHCERYTRSQQVGFQAASPTGYGLAPGRWLAGSYGCCYTRDLTVEGGSRVFDGGRKHRPVTELKRRIAELDAWIRSPPLENCRAEETG